MNTEAKAHGLDGSLVAPDWPPLTLDEVRSLLRQFPAVAAPTAILSVSPRPFSAASVIQTQESRVFIKRHHRSVRDKEGLLEEHRFLAHLHAHGAPVPRVLANSSAQTAIELAEWTYEVHQVPAGIDLYQDALSWTPFQSVPHAHSAGQALARLHQASQSFAAPPRQPRPLVAGFTVFAAQDPAAAIGLYLSARPALGSDTVTRAACAHALELLAPFHAELQPLLHSLPSLWTHNDLHASNLFWSTTSPNAHATAIIDFGLADRTNAVHDIAHAIERNIVEWLALTQDSAHESVPIHLDHLHAFLAGYQSIRPLSREEAAALAPMAALCHAEFALTEAHYFLAVLHSPEKALLATEGYLVAHARWFHSPRGQALLNALRTWASTRPHPSHGAHPA